MANINAMKNKELDYTLLQIDTSQKRKIIKYDGYLYEDQIAILEAIKNQKIITGKSELVRLAMDTFFQLGPILLQYTTDDFSIIDQKKWTKQDYITFSQYIKQLDKIFQVFK